MNQQNDQRVIDFDRCFNGEPPEGIAVDDLARARSRRRRRRQTAGAAVGGMTALALSFVLITNLPGPVGVPADQPGIPAPTTPSERAGERTDSEADAKARERELRDRAEKETKKRAQEKAEGTRAAKEAEVRARKRAEQEAKEQAQGSSSWHREQEAKLRAERAAREAAGEHESQ